MYRAGANVLRRLPFGASGIFSGPGPSRRGTGNPANKLSKKTDAVFPRVGFFMHNAQSPSKSISFHFVV